MRELSLINADGIIVASSNPGRIGQDESDNPIFIEGGKKIYVRDAYFSDIYKAPMIGVSAPVTRKDTGEFLGVMAARIDMGAMYAILMNRTGLGGTGEVFIVNKYGYMVTPSIFLKDTFLKEKVATANYRMAISDHKEAWPTVIAPDYRGVKVIGMHGHIPELQWVILSKIDLAEASRPLFKLRAALLAIVFLSAVAAWFLGKLAAYFITKPVRLLREGMRIVGRGDLDYRVEMARKDEIGQLSAEFDVMTGNLKNSLITIEALNKEIAERKKAEDDRDKADAALDLSERKSRAIFDQTLQLVGLTSPGGILLEVNKAALDMVGGEESSVIGKPFWDTAWWSHSPELQEKLKRAVDSAAHGQTVRFEATHPARDGSLRHIDFSLKPVKDESGKVIFLVPEGRDITEQKISSEMVLRAAKEWEATFDSMSEGVSIHDPDYTVVNVNSALCRLLGSSKEDVVGKKCYKLFHGKDAPPSGCPLERSVNTGKDEHVEIFEPLLGRWLSVSVSPVRDDNGKIKKLIHVINDITERKTFQEELARSEKLAALGRFAAGAAHEIKNPLGIILGGLELLQAGSDSASQEMKSTIATLSGAVLRTDSIINALSKLSEVVKLNIGRIDVKQFVEDTVFLMKSALARPGVKINVECQGGMYVEADAERLQEALTDVLNNAADSIKDTGDIDVKVKRDHSDCVIEIADTGEGISSGDISKVFEPFFTTRRDRKRVGLGLTVVREVIKMHKGDISLKSYPGKGTIVRITLPIASVSPLT
jgi:PAS domain S-box-containing protein